MKLHCLYYGRSKKRIKELIMIDSLHKCENMKRARENNVIGFHIIVPAPEGSKTKPKKQKWRSGYVSSGTWNPHT